MLPVLLLVVVLTLLYWNSRVPKGMPPGFMGLPVIGWPPLPRSGKRTHMKMIKRRYGSISTSKWGGRLVVLLNDAQAIRRCRFHPLIQRRPEIFSFGTLKRFLPLGVINAEGAVWTQNRKFALRHLAVIGTSGVKQEPVIREEVAHWLQYLEDQPLDQPITIDWSVNITILNILFKMLAGVRYKFTDEEIQNIFTLLNKATVITAGPVIILDIFPGLHKYMPTFIQNKIMLVNQLEKISDELWRAFAKIISDRRKVFDRDNPETLIDHYFIEAEEYADDPDSPFNNEDNLPALIGDLFVAASETTSSTIRWTALYLTLYPEVQRKIQEDIDKFVPIDRMPSLADKPSLAYLEAALLEVMRITSLFPMTAYCATEDMELEGYFIPKDTEVVCCMETVHRDPSEWEKPDEFYPEHFLDEEGRIRNRKNAFIPFSIGKRVCPGEELARTELFLIMSALLQRFSLSAPPGVPLAEYTEPVFTFLNSPRVFPLMLERRIKQ